MKKINKIVSISLIALVLIHPIVALAATKSETIYANLDNAGKPYKTIVNNHLYTSKKGEVNDETHLANILNINGDEAFTLNGNNIVWNALGKDIFYQGTTDKALPISLKATYYFDNEKVNPKEVVGKEGKVRIELKFTNNTTYQGSRYFVPFVVAVGTTLDSKNNTEIKVTNGKSIDTGNKSYIVGLSSPGLYSYMNLNEFKGSDKVVIDYKTTSFSLKDMYIVATPKLLDNADLAIFDKLDVLASSINTIEENMEKLEAGAKALEEGSIRLLAGSSELTNGLKQVVAGVQNLQNGSNELNMGVNTLYNSLLAASKSLQDPSVAGSIANVTKVMQDDASKITELMQDPVSNAEMIKLLKANIDNFQVLLQILSDTNDKINDMLNLLLPAVESIKTGTNNLNNGLITLKQSVNKLYNGSTNLNEGIKTLNSGATTLKSGITLLNTDGIMKLQEQTDSFKFYGSKAKALINNSKRYHGFASNNADKTTFIYKIGSVK